MKLAPTVIIATFMNDERTRAWHLQANGQLVEIVRDTPSDVWGPPSLAGAKASTLGSFEMYLETLTTGEDPATQVAASAAKLGADSGARAVVDSTLAHFKGQPPGSLYRADTLVAAFEDILERIDALD